MLHVTETAAQMIQRLAAEAQLPDGAGLRIADADNHPGLQMSLATEPGPDDAVLRERAAVIFLDPPATARLAGQTLDARSDARGSAFFLEP
ncbi:MAG: hypothetical protein M3N21_04670 [Actinomycetota bacterium]|nr:hypothetical protein [Actinomycetota bacterium]